MQRYQNTHISTEALENNSDELGEETESSDSVEETNTEIE